MNIYFRKNKNVVVIRVKSQSLFKNNIEGIFNRLAQIASKKHNLVITDIQIGTDGDDFLQNKNTILFEERYIFKP